MWDPVLWPRIKPLECGVLASDTRKVPEPPLKQQIFFNTSLRSSLCWKDFKGFSWSAGSGTAQAKRLVVDSDTEIRGFLCHVRGELTC